MEDTLWGGEFFCECVYYLFDFVFWDFCCADDDFHGVF